MRGIIVIGDKAIVEKIRFVENKLVEVHKLAHEIELAGHPIIQFTSEKGLFCYSPYLCDRDAIVKIFVSPAAPKGLSLPRSL